jgi:hypothetical protein
MRNYEPIFTDPGGGPDEGPQRIGGKKSGAWWLKISIAVMVIFVSSILLSRVLVSTSTIAPTKTTLSPVDSASGLWVSAAENHLLYDPTVISSSNGNVEPLQVPTNWRLSDSLSSDATSSGGGLIVLELDSSEAGLMAVHALCTGLGQLAVFLEPEGIVSPYPTEEAIFTCTPGGEEARVIFPNRTTVTQRATQTLMLVIQVIPVSGQAPPTWTVDLEVPI